MCGIRKGERPVWMLAVPLYSGGWFASSACAQILSPTPLSLSFPLCLPAPLLWLLMRSLVLTRPNITRALVLSPWHFGRLVGLACPLSLLLDLWLCGQFLGHPSRTHCWAAEACGGLLGPTRAAFPAEHFQSPGFRITELLEIAATAPLGPFPLTLWIIT